MLLRTKFAHRAKPVVKILRLDKTGLPTAWINQEEAATLYVKGQVLWSLGNTTKTLHGGINAWGQQSQLTLAPIVACDGDVTGHAIAPALTNSALFRRDDGFCMYCGNRFHHSQLTRDHVIPVSQRGRDVWTNVVASCSRCNNHKADRTPEQADMPLLAVPFRPNPFEYMYLANRNIIADQMEYLKTRFSNKTRRWQAA